MKTDSEILIGQIESAFSSVVLGDGIGLFQAEALDDYGNAEEVSSARIKDRELWKRWQEIPENAIVRGYTALCFADPEGMRFLLPAFMIFAVNNFKTSDAAAIDSVVYALDREPVELVGQLSQEQISTVIAFLKFMVLSAGENWVEAEVAIRAYENHWSKLER